MSIEQCCFRPNNCKYLKRRTTQQVLRMSTIGTACGRCLITFAFVCRIGSQRISKEAIFAPVTVEAGRVVDALQAFSCQAIAISNCIGIDVGVALALPAKPHGAV